MKRDLDALTGRTHDVLVIGGGIHGAFAAWDAALRGLSVALVDRADFGGGASANSLKVIHGGLRYLQQLDVRRMRESIHERSTLLRIAPTLMRPQPFVIATRGAGKESAAALGAALWLTDRIGADRNAGLAADRRLPGGRLVDRDELARLAPELPRDGASGGALWYDGQVTDPERLTLACVRAAADRGAAVANYVEVPDLIVSDGRVGGANAVDGLTGRSFAIRARATIVTTGGGPEWRVRRPGATPRARGRKLVPHRRLGGPAAFGVRSISPPDPGGSGGRYLFVVPWRESTMIGTFYRLSSLGETARGPSRKHLVDMIADVRHAMPDFHLAESDVRLVHAGVLPLKGGGEPGDPRTLAQRSRVLVNPQLRGMFFVVGVKFTTARALAREAVDLALASLGRGVRCATAVTPLDHARPAPAGRTPGEADVVRMIREEMAMRLADVVMRRTAMGTEGCPPRADLATVARIMARELGWDETRVAAEVHSVRAAYAPCDTSEPAAAEPMRAAHG